MPANNPGRFVWYDLFSKDPAASQKYYADLFGWQYENWGEAIAGEEYPMIKAGEQFLGGIATMKDPAASGPPHWTGYVSVEDVAATCAQVEELGGKVFVPPTDIPKVGNFAVIADPQGATICPFHSLNPEQPAPERSPDHTFCWRECLTADSASAAEFYSKVFGWRLEAHEMEVGGVKGTYRLFFAGDEMVGGCMDLPPPAVAAGALPHWLYYVMVADIDAMAGKAAELGGAVTCPPLDIPDTGRFCVITDPQGAMFALFKSLARE